MSDWNEAILEIEKIIRDKRCKDPACPRDAILLEKLAKLKRPAPLDGGWEEKLRAMIPDMRDRPTENSDGHKRKVYSEIHDLLYPAAPASTEKA